MVEMSLKIYSKKMENKNLVAPRGSAAATLGTTGLHINELIFKDTHRPALLPCRADLFVRCRGPSPKERQSSAAVKR